MRRVLVVGNSGSGKTTYARRLHAQHGLAHLDLDALAWLPGTPPERRPLEESRADVEAFVRAHPAWVIEGCYADLLAMAAPHADDLVYLDLPVAACVENARQRPFEPHKYETPQAQDANLPMLLDWIAGYETRDDACGAAAHRALYDGFEGAKQRIT